MQKRKYLASTNAKTEQVYRVWAPLPACSKDVQVKLRFYLLTSFTMLSMQTCRFQVSIIDLLVFTKVKRYTNILRIFKDELTYHRMKFRDL